MDSGQRKNLLTSKQIEELLPLIESCGICEDADEHNRIEKPRKSAGVSQVTYDDLLFENAETIRSWIKSGDGMEDWLGNREIAAFYYPADYSPPPCSEELGFGDIMQGECATPVPAERVAWCGNGLSIVWSDTRVRLKDSFVHLSDDLLSDIGNGGPVYRTEVPVMNCYDDQFGGGVYFGPERLTVSSGGWILVRWMDGADKYAVAVCYDEHLKRRLSTFFFNPLVPDLFPQSEEGKCDRSCRRSKKSKMEMSE